MFNKCRANAWHQQSNCVREENTLLLKNGARRIESNRKEAEKGDGDAAVSRIFGQIGIEENRNPVFHPNKYRIMMKISTIHFHVVSAFFFLQMDK